MNYAGIGIEVNLSPDTASYLNEYNSSLIAILVAIDIDCVPELISSFFIIVAAMLRVLNFFASSNFLKWVSYVSTYIQTFKHMNEDTYENLSTFSLWLLYFVCLLQKCNKAPVCRLLHVVHCYRFATCLQSLQMLSKFFRFIFGVVLILLLNLVLFVFF